jgi:RNA polymerase sigma factor (sigma-70 family)
MVEAELIARACKGDEAAYETLVRQHQEAVFRLAYLYSGDADEAEDIAQETFIAALRALPHFDTARPLRPWLLKIATNTAHNRRRSVGRFLAAMRRAFLADPPREYSTETESTQHWESQAVWEAVRRLNTVDQEIIYLRYFMELSVTETAEILKVEPGTVKSRLSRALGRLRGVVQRDFPVLYEGREA